MAKWGPTQKGDLTGGTPGSRTQEQQTGQPLGIFPAATASVLLPGHVHQPFSYREGPRPDSDNVRGPMSWDILRGRVC